MPSGRHNFNLCYWFSGIYLLCDIVCDINIQYLPSQGSSYWWDDVCICMSMSHSIFHRENFDALS